MAAERMTALDLALSGAVDAGRVDELREQWLEACWPGRAVRLDLSEVEAMHGAAAQLVLALKRRVEESGGTFAIPSASPAARQTAACLGLAGAWGLIE